jgi:hypothetical protein
MENPSMPEETEWVEKSTYLASFNQYDENENILRSESYRSEGELSELYEYRYDENGNLIEEICYFEEDVVAEHRHYTWNDKKQCISEKCLFVENDVESLTQFSYAEDGKLAEKAIMGYDGEIEEKETFTYIDGKLSTAALFDEEGNRIWEKIYEYEGDGLISTLEHISADEHDNFQQDFYYDNKGNLEKTLKYNCKQELTEKSIYQYDDSNQVVQLEEETVGNKKTSRFQYDEKGNQIKQEEYNNDGILITSIERNFNPEKRILESLVYIYDPKDNLHQMYAYKYEYEFQD